MFWEKTSNRNQATRGKIPNYAINLDFYALCHSSVCAWVLLGTVCYTSHGPSTHIPTHPHTHFSFVRVSMHSASCDFQIQSKFPNAYFTCSYSLPHCTHHFWVCSSSVNLLSNAVMLHTREFRDCTVHLIISSASQFC